MQKIWAFILLSALASNYEALPQTKWSRPIRNLQGQLTRERRQFPFGDWIPLSQSCPTCRLFADPLDAGLRGENIGLTPPRPPTVTRQIHGEGNFFPQDESSILSVPPPPPTITAANGNFQFSGFGQQFNAPLPVPNQKIVSQNQQIQFFPQTFLPNQPPLLVNGNQQILTGLNGQSNLFAQGQTQQQINNGKVTTSFQNSDFKTQKLPENVVLEQNKRPLAPKPFSNKPQPFTASQQNQQQTFVQQQAFGGQRQHSVNFGNTILTPPPAPNNVSQDIVIPGLDKEEIQLLYVPVETLRQRGTPQEQLLTQQPQNIQFYNRPSGFQRPVNNIRPTEQTLVTQSPKGHFVTQNGNNPAQPDSTLKVTSVQPFSTSVTPSTLLLQHLPFQQTPQPFVSATPATPTIQPFVTPAPVFQKFSSFTPETTLSHLSTVPNTVQFSQSDVDFGTTPKTISSQGVFQGELVNRKPEFSGLKGAGFTSQEQERPLQQQLQQSFVTQQQQVVTQPPQQNAVFTQEQQKEIHVQNQFPTQIDQTQVALQKQQENQRLLQQQRQKELEEQRFLEQQRKQKEVEEQRLIQQQRQKELEQQRFAQKQKELEEQRLIQQQRQKELEQQRFVQKQKELEEQRRLQQQQRQKELEQQRFLQKQKELEEQRLLQQQQRQKELEQQRFLQQQRQKELEEQRFLQEQRQKELEHQRRLQLQKQKELEEKRLLQQLKQKEEEQQRLLRFQLQQKELEQQKLLQAQQEHQQRLLQQQKQENLKNQQQFRLFQQQQKQNAPQQTFQQANRHILPDNDKLNLIPELEKESEAEDQQLVPHQPPLSVFFKGYNGAEARITDVLRELRSSNTITVLDQYFEKMPKVFVGPAGLIPPSGYGKFDLPYLSNLESNRVDRRIDKLPFFVAPLNFVPPPGYAKIPFPAPHVGSVVISSESNPAMKLASIETGIRQASAEEENNSGTYPVVGPELPGLINNLDTVTTTVKPTTYASTPSLPQTTAQLRNRRPNSSLYKPQSRKPITRTRSSTTSRPEEEVTQPIQKTEINKESEGVRKPFNRFLHRRRQQTKTTTESSLRGQQEGKNLENRYYSVEVYHQEKNQLPRTQLKSDVNQQNQREDQLNREFEHGSIDRITPGGHGVFEARPTPDYSRTHQPAGAVESEERHPETSDYSDINLQAFEEGPLPTGSAKTITQELYRPNAINQPEGDVNYKKLSKSDSTSNKFQSGTYEDVITTKFAEPSDVSPTAAADKDAVSEEHVSVPPTSFIAPEKQDASSEGYESTEASNSEVSFTPRPVTVSGDHQTKGFLDSNEQYTSAFAEISKHHHIPGFADSSQRHSSTFANAYPTPEISVDLQAPLTQDFGTSGEIRPTENAAGYSNSQVLPTGSSEYLSGFEGVQSAQQGISSSQVSPTAPGAIDSQYAAGPSANPEVQNTAQGNRHSHDERTASFISFHGVSSTENPQQHFPSSTPQPAVTESNPIIVEPNQFSSTPESVAEITVHPSVQTYTSGSEEAVQHNDQGQIAEGQGQDVADNLGNDHRLKLPNPSIVRVRTRVRGKSRGQVNFAASQSTTSAPYTRSGSDSRHSENADQDLTTKTNLFRDYNPVKTSKYNQFRGVKKPVRTTTEATTEYEHRANVYTIRPPRRPLSPSTVSTKRIRRPTTPLPSAEAATEAFGISTGGYYSQSEHSDISPSGVSNDVYYEQSSLSPVKNKFRKHFGSVEQKNDVVPGYSSTAFPTLLPTYSTAVQDGYSEESNIVRDVAQTAAPQENSDRYPEWNPSESGFDVSGIILTTIRTPGQEEQEVEEPKKPQDSKKAFDPDLEKKTGRRRVRVRVHKRPHENFETAESQNLRTVANVLVPPTTTYKPNDESGLHQLAKNADFSFGGQKLFGLRSREYFRKRLNLTEAEGVNKGDQAGREGSDVDESATGSKSLGLVKKLQKIEFESASASSNDSSEGSKIARPKFRGFVRKIVKHGGAGKDKESDSNQVGETDESESKHGSGEFHSRQQVRLNQGSFNQSGRVNGTKHKTFVRYVKKNKVRQHETESHVESSLQEVQKEGEALESGAQAPEAQQTSTTESQLTEVQQEQEEKIVQTQQETEVENGESQQPETTGEPEIKPSQQPSIQTTEATEAAETSESSSQAYQEFTPQTPASVTPQGGLYLTQRPKFFQTLRPVFQRTSQSGFYRTRETEAPSSTTEQSVQEAQEKRVGYPRFKYGKTTTGFGSVTTEKTEESKKVSEQQLKNKNLHTLEVRKYLRTKNREGAFSQFSRNRYFTSEKTESETTKHEESSQSEEITTERESEIPQTESPSADPRTTQQFARTDSIQPEGETTKTDNEQPTTTEPISSSEEESSEEEEEDEATTSFNLESTTETEVPTTVFRVSSTEAFERVSSTETPTTETQPDIYRFSKDSFSFDETEKFTGTKNRAHVRNITTDIIENTASFSAPGVEKRPDIHVVTQRVDEILPVATDSLKEKTEEATTEIVPETTTEYPETETTAASEAITKAKLAKILKTSTTTKISHETEICYRGKCIRTKSENPDEDLKLLVDSASTMKIEKKKT